MICFFQQHSSVAEITLAICTINVQLQINYKDAEAREPAKEP